MVENAFVVLFTRGGTAWPTEKTFEYTIAIQRSRARTTHPLCTRKKTNSRPVHYNFYRPTLRRDENDNEYYDSDIIIRYLYWN